MSYLGERGCSEDEFRCKRSRKCIPASRRCNDRRDCRDGSDERNCRTCRRGEFQCKRSGLCIPKSYKCDSHRDCRDGSDERNCPKKCRRNEFRCRRSGKCIPKAYRCDGFRDCRDRSDEKNCRCRRREFRCKRSGKCIPKSFVCDDHRDCRDGSDERNCWFHSVRYDADQRNLHASMVANVSLGGKYATDALIAQIDRMRNFAVSVAYLNSNAGGLGDASLQEGFVTILKIVQTDQMKSVVHNIRDY
ncbi:Basement membrane-specific heparan sulfate proteoglycan core protein [Trichoplax sp. H2]|nr:Basement membrane-specific heparan sulfate proteoglycan core protein [Trichoplax sp. H2]|eukprot:RDD37276.1 Basement membrane-specific heparan sulfate proteoglycan core protein [Trichoplax sp. H2]